MIQRNDPLFNFENEIVVITGVSGQLGLQYARAFLDRGARVAGLDIVDFDARESLESTYSGRFSFVTCNVVSRESVEEALSQVKARLGVPTVLINNAAIDSPPGAPLSETGPFEEYPDASFDKVMDVNVKGVYMMCKVFGGVMAAHEKGSIINISSIYGVVSPDQGIYEYRRQKGEEFYKPVAYSVSKSAVMNMTRYLAAYWAKKKVRVNTLVIAGVFNHQDDEFLDAYCGRIPIGRMADESDYDGAVLFLASAGSAYMTGASLTVDGGWTSI